MSAGLPCLVSQVSGLFNLLLCNKLHTWWWGHSHQTDTATWSLHHRAKQGAEQLRFRPWFCISASLCHTYLICAMGR